MGYLTTKKLGAGSLDRRISILEPTDGKDELGAPLTTYSQLKQTWAKVEYISAREKEVATQETSITQVAFTIRYTSGLDAKMIINYAGKVYDILGILEVEGRKNYLEIRAKQSEITAGQLLDQIPTTDGDGDIPLGAGGMAPIGGQID